MPATSATRPALRAKASSLLLPEPPRDVVLCQLFGRCGEDLIGPAAFHELAEPEKRRDVGDTGRLLHVVRDDDDRVTALQLINQLFDPLRGDRIERRRRL